MMKKKFLLVALMSVIFFGCSPEESIEELEVVNGNAFIGPPPFQCDPRWVAPIALPSTQGEILEIYYDTSLTLEEVNCIREEFFDSFCLLMVGQSSDPYHDKWIILPDCEKTGGTISGTTAEEAADDDEKVCPRRPCD